MGRHRAKLAYACLMLLLQHQIAWMFMPITRGVKRQRTLSPMASFKPHLPKFCSDCGEAAMKLEIPTNDERVRAVCSSCGRVEYSNPKIVVSCVVLTNDDGGGGDTRCLLAKRAIEPCLGMWGIPQGFMEHGETTREAAAREVLEETGVTVQDLQFRAVYNIPGSVQLLYEARVSSRVAEEQISTDTLESSDVAFFSVDCIPYDKLCFPTVKWALDHCLGANSSAIQQKTKKYNKALDTWIEYEDEPIL